MRHLSLRILSILLTLTIVSFIVFILQANALGDSASYILSEEAGGAAADAYRASISSDGPVMVRYIEFLLSFISGKWGNTVSGQSIREIIGYRYGVTISLSVLSVLSAIAISIPVSLISVRTGTIADKAASSFSVLFLSIPSFLTAFFLILVFSMILGLFPPAGYIQPSVSLTGWARSVFLPSFSLSLLHAALITRIFRKALRENMLKPYSVSLAAAGASEAQVLMKGALKPSLPVLYTLIASSLASALAGSAVTESVFALPGIGSLLVTAALSRDALLSGTIVMLTALSVSVIYAVLEVVLLIIDPRSRRES